MNTFFYAPGTGIVVSRSGWGSGSTQILFSCGPVRESHDDRATAEFLIHSNGVWLASESKLASHGGISGESINHNCLTVNAKPQSWTEDQAQIVAQEDTPVYTYLNGDATAAYLGQLSQYNRELLFVKPGYLLVRDTFTPIVPNSAVVWHLHSLAPAGGDINANGVVSAFKAGALFGVTLNPVGGFAFVTVQNDPLDTKSFRTDLAADPSNEILVALEAGSPTQTARTITKTLVTPEIKGALVGGAFAGWLTGTAPWNYTSPVSGPHILAGAKPNAVYFVSAPSGSSTITSSSAGVLSWSSLASAGTPITISETPIVVPPPSVTVMTGKKYAYLMVNGTLTLSEVTS